LPALRALALEPPIAHWLAGPNRAFLRLFPPRPGHPRPIEADAGERVGLVASFDPMHPRAGAQRRRDDAVLSAAKTLG